eukprot:g62806.t1
MYVAEFRKQSAFVPLSQLRQAPHSPVPCSNRSNGIFPQRLSKPPAVALALPLVLSSPYKTRVLQALA